MSLRPSRRSFWAVALLALLLLQGLLFISESSQTSDEAAHLLAGYTYLRTGNFLAYPGEPPLMKELAALPLLFFDLDLPASASSEMPRVFLNGPRFLHENRVPGDTLLFAARIPVLLLSLLLGLALYRWGLRLYGRRGALLALALYVLDPNIVAHSGLVMTDLGAAFFFLLTVYGLWCWSERPRRRTLVLTGLALGGAFAAKYTALWLLPILLILGAGLMLGAAPIPGNPIANGGVPAGRRVARRAGSLAIAGLVLAAVGFLVVLLTYAGQGLPAYGVGLARGLTHSQAGFPGYLMGRWSHAGFWYYFLFAYLVKTPLGTLAVVTLALLTAAIGLRRLPARDEMFLWIPVAVILAVTAVWRINIGLRHILPLYPFLCLAAGRVGARAGSGRLLQPPPAGSPDSGSKIRRLPARLLPAAAGLAVAGTAVEAAAIAPYHLAYFNALIGGPSRAHLYLLDSNLDWGQASRTLTRYVASQGLSAVACAFTSNSDPWYYGLRYQYVPGVGNLESARTRGFLLPEGQARELLAVSPMSLHWVRLGTGTLYDWLKDRPVVAMPGHAYLVYDLTGDAGAHASLAQLYLEWGMPDFAAAEARRALRLDPGHPPARRILERLAPAP